MSNATLHSLPQRRKRKKRRKEGSIQIADEENIENATGIEVGAFIRPFPRLLNRLHTQWSSKIKSIFYVKSVLTIVKSVFTTVESVFTTVKFCFEYREICFYLNSTVKSIFTTVKSVFVTVDIFLLLL